jgi:hydroxyacylglutathione hydrolase
MQLTDHIYLVGGGPFTGFGLTSGPDCHVYLIDGGDELALVDSGLGLESDFERLIENVSNHGFDPGDIATVALTHYHGDHAGGAARAQREFEATLAIHVDAAEPLEAADEIATGLEAALVAGVFPGEARLEECSVGMRLEDGDEITVGELTLRFIATPGHARGHGSYHLEGSRTSALFTGDALFWAGRVLLQAVPDCDLQDSIESLRRLASLEFEGFFPGHGALAVSGGQVHAAMAKAEIDVLGVPKNIV